MNPNFILLYVDSPTSSVAFYEKLLDRKPIEASANFAMFALTDGLMLGLWARHDVTPRSESLAGGSEVAFTVESEAAVDAMHDVWQRKGFPIAQAPVTLDFGRTFVAVDPDGHRLRVFAPPA